MTRDDILDAAAQVFRRKGFHGASMADIADSVNLKKPSLYHHVTSKQEILVELLERALRDHEIRIEKPVAASAPQRFAMPPIATIATYRTDFMTEASDGPIPPL